MEDCNGRGHRQRARHRVLAWHKVVITAVIGSYATLLQAGRRRDLTGTFDRGGIDGTNMALVWPGGCRHAE